MDGDLKKTVQLLREKNIGVVIRDEREFNREILSEVIATCPHKEKEKATCSSQGKEKEDAPNDNVLSKAESAQRARRERERAEQKRQPRYFPNLTPKGRRRRRACFGQETSATKASRSTFVPHSASSPVMVPRPWMIIRTPNSGNCFIGGRTPTTMDTVTPRNLLENAEKLMEMKESNEPSQVAKALVSDAVFVNCVKKTGSSCAKTPASKGEASQPKPEKKAMPQEFSSKDLHDERISSSLSQSPSSPKGGQPEGGLNLPSAQTEEKDSQSADVTLKKESEETTVFEKHVDEGSGVKQKVSLSVTKSLTKDESCLKWKHTPRKGKRTAQKEEDPELPHGVREYGNELVGCKIKVWWPNEQKFFKGVIVSFDCLTKKHRVLYVDGDEEILTLSKERWELVGNNTSRDLGQENSSLDALFYTFHLTDSLDHVKKKHKVLGDPIQKPSEHLSVVKEEPMTDGGQPIDPPTPDLASGMNGRHPSILNQISRNEREEKLRTGTFPTNLISPSITERSNTCSDTVDVRGYKVKASAAPTLEAIFAKHGDIALNCLYKSASVRTSLLEVVCDVVHRLQSNDLAHVLSELKVIENEVADAEAAKLEVSWLRKHLEKIHKVGKVGQTSSLLKNAKVYSVLVSKAAAKELGERNVELLEALERVKHAEKRVNVFKLVSRKISDEVLESEAEEYFWRRRLDGVL